jgi:hypothetical protein
LWNTRIPFRRSDHCSTHTIRRSSLRCKLGIHLHTTRLQSAFDELFAGDQPNPEGQLIDVQDHHAALVIGRGTSPVHASGVSGIDHGPFQTRRREYSLVSQRLNLLSASGPFVGVAADLLQRERMRMQRWRKYWERLCR